MVMAQTRKRKIILANLNKRYLDTPSVHFHKTSLSLEDSYVTIKSSSNNSFSSDSQEMRFNHRYIKHSQLIRNDEHVTSLKRRIRRQQSIHDQNQSTNLYSISFSKPPMTSSLNRPPKSNSVVPLPALIPNLRIIRTRVRDIKLNK